MPSKKKKYNARFPPARIKKIMQMDEEVGKVAATVPVIISRALELFIESLIQQATQTTLSKNAKTLSTSHIKQTIESQERYSFLRELVANIPDHQVDEEGGSGLHNNGEESSSGAAHGKRPRGRPRKVKDGASSSTVPKKERRKRKKESSESSESDNSEETDDAEEETDEEQPTAAASTSTSTASATAAATASNGDGPSRMAAEFPSVPATATTLTQPPPLSQLLGRAQHPDEQLHEQQPFHQHQQHQHHLPQQHPHPQQQHQQQQQAHDGSVPMVSSTFQAPTMMPAAMPMYQSMPGAATPHLFNWPGPNSTMPGMMAPRFPPMATQASTFPGMQPQGAGFPPMAMPGMGFPGMAPPVPGYPGLPTPGAGLRGMSPLGQGFPGMGVPGAGFPGVQQKAPAMVGAPSGAQADDDYDT